MLPTKNDWKNWSTLERATYIAQLTIPLTLLATVVFSWLGYREAHLSRVGQDRFFISENAPEIELSGAVLGQVDLVDGPNEMLTVTLRNTGGSPAHIKLVEVFVVGETKPLAAIGPNSGPNTNDDPDSNIVIRKGQEESILLVRADVLAKHLGAHATSVRTLRYGVDKYNSTEHEVIVLVDFDGPDGYRDRRHFMLALDTSPASRKARTK